MMLLDSLAQPSSSSILARHELKPIYDTQQLVLHKHRGLAPVHPMAVKDPEVVDVGSVAEVIASEVSVLVHLVGLARSATKLASDGKVLHSVCIDAAF
jgi:hypothetical protein